MAKVLVIYYSRSGNTKRMAEAIFAGAQIDGVAAELKKVEDTTIDDMFAADAIIMGSPTYFGIMAAPCKELIDKSVKYFKKMKGKVGGAFTSSGMIGGGNETTIMSILEAWLIHGMVIPGVCTGNHYGPVAIGDPKEEVLDECREYGRIVAELAKKLHG